jgi:hypothetical protein
MEKEFFENALKQKRYQNTVFPEEQKPSNSPPPKGQEESTEGPRMNHIQHANTIAPRSLSRKGHNT